MGKKQVNIGLFGAGRMAEWHLKSYARIPDARVIGICNPHSDRGRELARKFNIPNAVRSEEELYSLPGLMAVDVCVPTGLHKKLICGAIRHGLDVYTEKPLCRSLAEADEIVDLNKECKKIIFVGFNLRFCREFRQIKQVIDSGALGEIRYILMIRTTSINPDSFMYKQEMNAGIITEFGSHFVDLLRWWGFSDIEHLYADGSRVMADHPDPDSVTLTLKYRSGALATVINTHALPGLAPEIRIIGSKKNLTLKYGKIMINDLPAQWSLPSFLWLTLKESIILPYRILYNPFIGSCKSFVECVQAQKKALIDEREGRENMNVMEMLTESYCQNRIIRPRDIPDYL